MLDLSRMFSTGMIAPQFQPYVMPDYTGPNALPVRRAIKLTDRLNRGRGVNKNLPYMTNVPGAQTMQDSPAQASSPSVSRITADPFVSEGMAASQGNPFGAMNFSGMLGRQGFF